MTSLRSFYIFAAIGVSSVFAHDPGLSTAHVARENDRLEVTLTFAWSDLAPMVPSRSANERPTSDELRVLSPRLANSAAGFVRIASNTTTAVAESIEVSTGSGSANEVIVLQSWRQVAPAAVRLEFPVLDRLSFGHRMIVLMGDSNDALALLDKQHATWEVPAEPSRSAVAKPRALEATADWPAFIRLGVEHILTGFDHLCFLLALLLVAVRLRDVLAVVTTFTVAHSLTLAAAATGIVSLSPRIVEPLIAVSIIYVAVENLVLDRPPRHRLAVVFAFGLIHGLGFATALAERLPGVSGRAIVPPLLAFNGGVELGQLAVAACLVPLLNLARRHPSIAPRLQPGFSLLIAVAGMIWFWQRV